MALGIFPQHSEVRLLFMKHAEAVIPADADNMLPVRSVALVGGPESKRGSVGWLTFKCPKCRTVEVYTVGVAGRLIPRAGGAHRRPSTAR